MSALGLLITYDGSEPVYASYLWYPVATFAVLGLGYVHVSSSATIGRDYLHIRNPFHQVRVPLGDIRAVETGMTMIVRTKHRRYHIWAVEGGAAQAAAGFGEQDELIEQILAAARTGPQGDAPARYRFSSPDPLFWAAAAAHVASFIGIFVQL